MLTDVEFEAFRNEFSSPELLFYKEHSEVACEDTQLVLNAYYPKRLEEVILLADEAILAVPNHYYIGTKIDASIGEIEDEALWNNTNDCRVYTWDADDRDWTSVLTGTIPRFIMNFDTHSILGMMFDPKVCPWTDYVTLFSHPKKRQPCILIQTPELSPEERNISFKDFLKSIQSRV